MSALVEAGLSWFREFDDGDDAGFGMRPTFGRAKSVRFTGSGYSPLWWKLLATVCSPPGASSVRRRFRDLLPPDSCLSAAGRGAR